MSTTPGYQLLEAWVSHFIGHHPGTPQDGDYYELPGTVVYHTHKQRLAGKGQLQLNQVTSEGQPHFHWRSEITLDDGEAGIFKHILLQADGTVVETYGKQVIPVSDEEAQQLLSLITSSENSGR